MPSRAAAAKRGSGGAPMFGVPWCQKTASLALSAPVSYSATVAQLQIGLCHHPPSLKALARLWPAGGSARKAP